MVLETAIELCKYEHYHEYRRWHRFTTYFNLTHQIISLRHFSFKKIGHCNVKLQIYSSQSFDRNCLILSINTISSFLWLFLFFFWINMALLAVTPFNLMTRGLIFFLYILFNHTLLTIYWQYTFPPK